MDDRGEGREGAMRAGTVGPGVHTLGSFFLTDETLRVASTTGHGGHLGHASRWAR